MNRRIVKILMTSLLAATIGTATFSAPALAGGSFSLSVMTSDPEDAQAIKTGMALYSLFNGLQNGANITQNGSGNMAGIGQMGTGNQGIVHQEGNGHTGTISQNGNDNACALFQFGENTDAACVQNGDDQAGATFAIGW